VFKYSPQHPAAKHPQYAVKYSPNVRDQASYEHTETDKSMSYVNFSSFYACNMPHPFNLIDMLTLKVFGGIVMKLCFCGLLHHPAVSSLLRQVFSYQSPRVVNLGSEQGSGSA
jgi:hypothetical protein